MVDVVDVVGGGGRGDWVFVGNNVVVTKALMEVVMDR